jgi:hypothetical protein
VDSASVVALIVGIIGSGGISGLIAYGLGGRNERKKDERAALARYAEDARTFQRDTLLEIHDLLYKLNRNTGKCSHIDEMRYREIGRFGRDPYPDELSEEFTELLTSINRLRVRIFDPELRALIEQYTTTIVGSTGVGQRTDGDDAEVRARCQELERRATEQYEPLEDRLGVGIRVQFPGSDVHPTPGMVLRLPPGRQAAGTP